MCRSSEVGRITLNDLGEVCGFTHCRGLVLCAVDDDLALVTALPPVAHFEPSRTRVDDDVET